MFLFPRRKAIRTPESARKTLTRQLLTAETPRTDRVINGITLYTMTGEGQSVSANSCSLTVLEGTVANGGGAAESIKADGTVSQVVADMTFNNEANDGSEQEIRARSREPHTRHDLTTCAFTFPTHRGRTGRLISSFSAMASRRWRPVGLTRMMRRAHLAGSKMPNQVYYINYRYTWDGDTTPGIAISQRYGRTPFCLYALTNQIVPGEELGTTEQVPKPRLQQGRRRSSAGGEAEAAPAESGGLSAGFAAASADDVGVTSDTFYSDETLNSNGEWVDVERLRASAGGRPSLGGLAALYERQMGQLR